jgi:ankyrin repeat protein
MHAERDCLIKRVFPRLREWLFPYLMYMVDIDLRWGITREEAEHDKVLELCLQEIDNCQPFFIGLLGQRYGWIPTQISSKLKDKLSLPGSENRSITELEILYGVLKKSHKKNRALFCIRSPQALETIHDHESRQIYEDIDSDLRKKLDSLKNLINTSGYHVLTYNAEWDPQKKIQGLDSSGAFSALKTFEDNLFRLLKDSIKAEYDLPDKPALSEQTNEKQGFETFIEFHLQFHINRSRIENPLLEYARKGDNVPMLVFGQAGCGKSALFCSIVHELRKDASLHVIPFFAGTSSGTDELSGMLTHLCKELGCQTSELFQIDKLITSFVDAILSIPEDRRTVIVIDSVESMEPKNRISMLNWLPSILPDHVRILFNCRSSKQIHHEVHNISIKLDFSIIEIPILSDTECEKILLEFPSITAKTLDVSQRQLLLSNKATRNPLYLQTVLAELRGYGVFETLNERIKGFPQLSSETDIESVQIELFSQIISRILQDFENKVAHSLLKALACSRSGMTEYELIGFCHEVYKDELFAILRHIRPYLMFKGQNMAFHHSTFNDAIRKNLLKEEKSRESFHESLGHFFYETCDDLNRKAEEVPWQYLQAKSWKNLCRILLEPDMQNTLWKQERIILHQYWTSIEENSEFSLVELALITARHNQDKPDFLYNLSILLQKFGYLRESITVLSYLSEDEKNKQHISNYYSLLNLQGLNLIRSGNSETALKYFLQAEEICIKYNYEDEIASIWGNMAMVYLERDDLSQAELLIRQQEKICRRLDKKSDLCSCLGNLAAVWIKREQFTTARGILEEKEQLCLQENNQFELQVCYGQWALWNQEQKKITESLSYLLKKEEICRNYGFYQDLDSTQILKVSCLEKLKCYDEALVCCDEVITRVLKRALSWEAAKVFSIRAVILSKIEGREQEALWAVDKAILTAERTELSEDLFLLRVLREQVLSQLQHARKPQNLQYEKMQMAADTGDLDTIKRLYSAGVPLEIPGTVPLLTYAVRKPHMPTIRWLIEKGITVDSAIEGVTALLNALGHDSNEAAVFLLDHGASVERVKETDRSPLIQAAKNGNVQLVNELLNRGANIETHEKSVEDGKNALMFAAKFNRTEVVRTLLETGARPNARDTLFHRTPSMYAAVTGNLDMLRLLMDYGADQTMRSFDGLRVSDYAKTNEISDYLEQRMPDKKFLADRLAKMKESCVFNDLNHRIVDCPMLFVTAWQQKIPAAYLFPVHHGFLAGVEVVDAARVFNVRAGSIFQPDTWHCTKCFKMVPNDAVFNYMSRKRTDVPDNPPKGDDFVNAQRFLENPCCQKCGNKIFAIINTSGHSNHTTATKLTTDQEFMQFVVDKLKELDLWADEVSETEFLSWDIEKLIKSFETLAQEAHTLHGGQKGTVPSYYNKSHSGLCRESTPDDKQIEKKIKYMAPFSYSGPQTEDTVFRSVKAVANHSLPLMIFFGIPYVWYRNIGRQDYDEKLAYTMKYSAIENLIFKLAENKKSISQEDVIDEIRFFMDRQ